MSDIREKIPVCAHGEIKNVSLELAFKLKCLENLSGEELIYTSGYRCPACNAKAGGVKNSAHLRGLAVDIHASTSADRFKICKSALMLGFRRIGIARNFIHLDIDKSLPSDVIWLY